MAWWCCEIFCHRPNITVRQFKLGDPSFESSFRVSPDRSQYNIAPRLAYFEDPSNHLTVQDLISPNKLSQFKPDGRETLNRGFATHTLWATINIQNNTNMNLWYVVLGYALLDEVEAYILDGEGHIRRVAQAGDTLPFKARPIQVASITLPVALPTGVQTRIF